MKEKNLKIEGVNKKDIEEDLYIKQVFKYVEKTLGAVEALIVFPLKNGRPSGYRLFNIGSINESPVNIQGLAIYVFSKDEKDFIVAHNHPSKRQTSMKPSNQDIIFFEKTQKMFETIGKNVRFAIYSNQKNQVNCSSVQEQPEALGSMSRNQAVLAIKEYCEEKGINIFEGKSDLYFGVWWDTSDKMNINFCERISGDNVKKAIKFIKKNINEGVHSFIRIKHEIVYKTKVFEFMSYFDTTPIVDTIDMQDFKYYLNDQNK